jgi:hypothetical protein
VFVPVACCKLLRWQVHASELVTPQHVKKHVFRKLKIVCVLGEISGSHSREYEDDCLALWMEAVSTSKMPVNFYKTIWSLSVCVFDQEVSIVSKAWMFMPKHLKIIF